MLLNSLLRRLNGGADATSLRVSSSRRRGSPLIYEKHPVLATLFLKILGYKLDTPGVFDVGIQQTFAALEVVERFGFPESNGTEFLTALKHQLRSPFWAVRRKTAKAMSFGFDQSKLLEEAHVLLTENSSSCNELHGTLMCLSFLLQRLKSERFERRQGRNQI